VEKHFVSTYNSALAIDDVSMPSQASLGRALKTEIALLVKSRNQSKNTHMLPELFAAEEEVVKIGGSITVSF
jgi:hypothetical protein